MSVSVLFAIWQSTLTIGKLLPQPSQLHPLIIMKKAILFKIDGEWALEPIGGGVVRHFSTATAARQFAKKQFRVVRAVNCDA